VVFRSIRKTALPVLHGTDQNGKAWDLKALKGKAVILNFWATWCAPCKEELPSLQTLADLQEGALQVLTVNVKEPAQRAWRYAHATGLQVPVIPDPKGELAQAFGVKVFPTTLVIDVQGQPLYRVVGAVDWTDPNSPAVISRKGR
jgi:thiol-disulfide isomerase/thioredoxin